MPNEDKKPDDDTEVPTTPADEGDDTEEGDDDPSEVITDPVETEVDNDPQFLAALSALAKHGIVLPQDTTAKNLCERINIAVIAIGGAKKDEPDGDEPQQPNADTPMTINGNQPTENRTQPLQMSFAGKAEERALAKAAALERKTIVSRINHIEKTGRVTPAIATRLRGEATKLNLSFSDTGDLVESPLLIKIAAYEALEKNSSWQPSAKKKVSLSHAATPPEPEGLAAAREGSGGISDKKFQEEWIM